MAFWDMIFNLFETIVRNWLTGFLHRHCRKQRDKFDSQSDLWGKRGEIGSYTALSIAAALIIKIIVNFRRHLFKFFRSFCLEKLHLYVPIVISVYDLFPVKAQTSRYCDYPKRLKSSDLWGEP
ncbi:hypothetical protein LOAG_06632 [Loa loa]|uniref:Uncharacterized protein n=1 Tax=Loa loa TaxID=7209 RepID=A0A1S0TY02_LOALO|nr:hypothetical protein LOAG_06632 [Loa loa]EFO21852.1 hypothetical protein LOAG_06632 [Loa loa]